MSRRSPASLAIGLALILGACGGAVATPSAIVSPSAPASASPSPSEAPRLGAVEPAPGSDSAIYAPNPAAIVVAIDAGHGGCLDWGVPDPSARGVELAEKTMTLAMARALRDRLEADGITVVMIRDGDDALAGDDYPELGCNGPGWRDVNGDGEAGFDPEGATRTRDELQARLDLANLSGADAFVSIHVNSPFDGGQTIEIAFSETFYTDETPWGDATERLARGIQDGVVASLAAVADYERGDRGITAHNFYLVAPTLFEPTPERPDPVRQPTRGALMPTVLAEVGSITLRAEHDLLASPAGHAAVADGLYAGLVDFFAQRDMAARIGLEDRTPGTPPDAVPGDGPPFWAPEVPDGPLRLRVTNTGTTAIEAGAELVAGWEPSDQPYLAAPPAQLAPIGEALPALQPGESIVVEAVLPQPPAGARGLAWISLLVGSTTLSELGSPALQLASGTP
ncbi:MAG TPA: N-acetylmuramoyl-L-alanine amidase [Patescibacteria group bacterium]|nr:N-acetylmuramoyl-L-alanine amidase [Patescibacteria group bacterium]